MSAEKDNLGLIGCVVLWISMLSVVAGVLLRHC